MPLGPPCNGSETTTTSRPIQCGSHSWRTGIALSTRSKRLMVGMWGLLGLSTPVWSAVSTKALSLGSNCDSDAQIMHSVSLTRGTRLHKRYTRV
jgi:hypothetical protein